MSDLISRQAAIEAIESHLRVGDEVYPLTRTDKILNHAFEIAASCVYNLPTAERVGKWIKNADENCWWYECSECGDYPMKNAWGHEELSAYCPHCGARMEGEEG